MTVGEMNDLHGGELPPGQSLAPMEPAAAKPKAKGKPSGRPPPSGAKTGRWALFNGFIDTVVSGLTRVETDVWLVLFRDTKRDTGHARTGQTDMARRVGCTVRAVQTAVASLEAKGLLTVVRRGRINAGPSTYRVKLPG